MDFYVPVSAILIELRNCSDNATEIEIRKLVNNEINLSNYTIVQLMSSLLGSED
jgi:hypothetical protein